MQNNNTVLFKGRRNGITILLDNNVDFPFLKEALQRKVADAGHFFNGARTNITFKGRQLSDAEETELLDIIKHSNMEIGFIVDSNEAAAMESITAPFNIAEHIGDENKSLFHRGSLRSGQAIHYTGSVVVLGDVNPGAEVIATGNIVILGSLKGLVHAGCKGNADCFVSALNMSPTQLRIANIITYIPEDFYKKNKTKKAGTGSSYAYVKGGQIYITPLA